MKSKNPPTYKKKKQMGKTGFKLTKWAETIEGGWLVDGQMQDEQTAPPPEPSAKPGSVAASTDNMQLFVKAGAAEGETQCPFSQTVRMVLHEKGIEYKLTPIASDDKPVWLVNEFGGLTPVLEHDGEKYSESVEIGKYLDFFFPNPSLGGGTDATQAAIAASSGFFPALATYLKATDRDADAAALPALEAACAALERQIGGKPYLEGVAPTLADFVLAPQLYQATVALPALKSDMTALPAAVATYAASLAALPSFVATAPSAATVTAGWETARA